MTRRSTSHRWSDEDISGGHHIQEPILIGIPRNAIDAQAGAAAVGPLLTLVSTASLAHAAFGNTQIAVLGYEDDRRELWQIPEVCEYIEGVTLHFPYSCFVADLNSDTLLMLVLCSCQSDSLSPGLGVVDSAALGAFIKKGCESTWKLCQRVGIPGAIAEQRIDALLAYFDARTR